MSKRKRRKITEAGWPTILLVSALWIIHFILSQPIVGYPVIVEWGIIPFVMAAIIWRKWKDVVYSAPRELDDIQVVGFYWGMKALTTAVASFFIGGALLIPFDLYVRGSVAGKQSFYEEVDFRLEEGVAFYSVYSVHFEREGEYVSIQRWEDPILAAIWSGAMKEKDAALRLELKRGPVGIVWIDGSEVVRR